MTYIDIGLDDLPIKAMDLERALQETFWKLIECVTLFWLFYARKAGESE
jgi:hypothetical protein